MFSLCDRGLVLLDCIVTWALKESGLFILGQNISIVIQSLTSIFLDLILDSAKCILTRPPFLASLVFFLKIFQDLNFWAWYQIFYSFFYLYKFHNLCFLKFFWEVLSWWQHERAKHEMKRVWELRHEVWNGEKFYPYIRLYKSSFSLTPTSISSFYYSAKKNFFKLQQQP